MIYLYQDQGVISQNVIVDKNKKILGLSKTIDKNYLTSRNIIDECLTPRCINKKITELKFFKTDDEISLLKKLLSSNIDRETKKCIINNIEQFNDFSYFTFILLDNIDIKEINKYDLDSLLKIKKMSEELKLYSEATTVLKHAEIAKQNTKMLKLVNKVRNL